MRWRIPILVAVMTAGAAGSADAQQARRNAVSLSVSAGKPVGLVGDDSPMPALGVGYSYALTRRLAFEVALTTMKSPHGLDQVEAGAIVYARPITQVNAWLPYVRVAMGATSDDFTELPSFPMARVGAGAEYTLRPSSSGIPGISRPHTAWGLRVEASAELFNAAAYDAGRRDGLAAFARVSLALVHRF